MNKSHSPNAAPNYFVLQSNIKCRVEIGLHVAIIMDGNGRWAARRRLPRTAGHKAGVDAIHRTVEAAPGAGVGTLTLFAFSADNWKRPEAEVAALMQLLSHYLDHESLRLADSGVRLTVIGRRDRLACSVVERIARVEAATAHGQKLHLRIAIDYSARHAILAAAHKISGRSDVAPEAFAQLLSGDDSDRDVDLLIRTSGEQRLSDFLLWECAYAELYFTNRLWPDFAPSDLREALADFAARDRRFGGVRLPLAAE